MASAAQPVVLSVWHEVHGLGILYLSVIAGVMNANVCARTLTFAIVTSIFGMWHATHSLPVEPSLWCVCAASVAVRGPFRELGPWQSRKIWFAGFRSSA